MNSLKTAQPQLTHTLLAGIHGIVFCCPVGEYFATHQGFLDSRRDKLEPLTRDRAIDLWAKLPQKLAKFDRAFDWV